MPEGIVEIWKDAEGFPWYQVSNLGRVKRLAKIIPANRNPSKPCRLKEKILIQTFTPKLGYHVFIKNSEGIRKLIYVSRLLLTAFSRLPKEGEFARHLDDNKRNQDLKNLAWGTRQDNVDDAVRNGRYIRTKDNTRRHSCQLC